MSHLSHFSTGEAFLFFPVARYLEMEHRLVLETEAHTFPATLEPVQARRIVDEYLRADRRVGRPYRELIEYAAIVDLEQRRWVARFSAKRWR